MGQSRQEKRALMVSILGAALMAVLGISFAFVADSEAIMLDGVFSTISFFMATLTLKVAQLVNRPDDEQFHFGYSHFAPLLNVVKSALLVILCALALIAAVEALLHGGRSMALGSAVLYGVLATLGCLAIAIYIRRAYNATGSALVAVDAESWAIDTKLSGAVLLAFCIGWGIGETPLAAYLDYLDPAVVTILCLISLPVPIRILLENAREVLLFAPDPAWQQAVEDRFSEALPDLPVAHCRFRLLKMGNTLNIMVHVKPGPEFELHSLAQLDDIRARFNTALESMDVKTYADIIFVDDARLAD